MLTGKGTVRLRVSPHGRTNLAVCPSSSPRFRPCWRRCSWSLLGGEFCWLTALELETILLGSGKLGKYTEKWGHHNGPKDWITWCPHWEVHGKVVTEPRQGCKGTGWQMCTWGRTPPGVPPTYTPISRPYSRKKKRKNTATKPGRETYFPLQCPCSDFYWQNLYHVHC